MTIQPQRLQRIPQGIEILWSDQHLSPYLASYLRARCPCAVCRERPEPGPLPEIASMDIVQANPIGRYAFQFVFNDRHDTGIYSFELLRKICPCALCQSSGSGA